MVATAPTYSVTCWGTFVMIVNAHLHIHTSTWKHAKECSSEMQQTNWIQEDDKTMVHCDIPEDMIH